MSGRDAAGDRREGLAAVTDMDRHIADILRRHGALVPVENVGALVEDLLGSLSQEMQAQAPKLYGEVEALAAYIRAARADIAALKPTDIRESFLPTATDELDAIVEATENATGVIMDAAEEVETLAETLDADTAGRLQTTTTKIYEACSFQDLTGQRITKVVRLLKTIEDRVDGLITAFDPGAAGGGVSAEVAARAGNHGRASMTATGDTAADADLLNGPQRSEHAMRQDDIDALLKGSD